MANVHITSDYTIMDVKMSNTSNDAQVWYWVKLQYTGLDPEFYTTPINDDKFPKGLAKDDFIANALPLINAQHSYFAASTVDDLDSWDTEA